MFNWNDICTKYRSYQLAGDYGGMITILNQIKNYYNVATNAEALLLIREFCNQYYPGFDWELPVNPEAQIDCYDCRAQIMQRYMASEGCPEGWIASPVLAATGVSKNPCETRNTTSGQFSQFGEVNFYSKTTGKSIGDPVLMRGGSKQRAVRKKIGSTMTTQEARKYKRVRGVNTSMLSNGYPINSKGIKQQPLTSGGYPINSRGILQNPKLTKGFPINDRGVMIKPVISDRVAKAKYKRRTLR